MIGDNKEFPNGITSYLETYYEIATAIEKSNEYGYLSKKVTNVHESKGRGGLYELAEDLTDKFETLHKGEDWIELDFFDTIDEFLEKELI